MLLVHAIKHELVNEWRLGWQGSQHVSDTTLPLGRLLLLGNERRPSSHAMLLFFWNLLLPIEDFFFLTQSNLIGSNIMLCSFATAYKIINLIKTELSYRCGPVGAPNVGIVQVDSLDVALLERPSSLSKTVTLHNHCNRVKPPILD